MPKLTPNDHIQGDPKAPYTLVEYGDFQCPSCAQALPLIAEVKKQLGDKLAFAFRNYPLEMHENAEAAAETAEFAAAHGKFWEMHDLLYKHQTALQEPHLLTYARQLHLDPDALKTALVDGTYAKRVHDDIKNGDRNNVQATPTFFVNGQPYDGSYDAESLVAALKA